MVSGMVLRGMGRGWSTRHGSGDRPFLGVVAVDEGIGRVHVADAEPVPSSPPPAAFPCDCASMGDGDAPPEAKILFYVGCMGQGQRM